MPTFETVASKKYVDSTRIGRNRIINGDFSVNQRALTSTTTTSAYGLDRWRWTYLGGSCTYSAQTAITGELPESANNFARIVVSGQTTGHSATFRQYVEDVRVLSGKTTTLSFWARAASGTPEVGLSYTRTFGTGGSTLDDLYVGKVNISTTWQRYSLVFNMPSCAGKTIGTDSLIQVRLWLSGSTIAGTGPFDIQNNTFDFWGIQFEEGSVATAYEQKTYAEELRACQRYYQQSMPSNGSATGLEGYAENFAIFNNRISGGTAGYWGSLPFWVPMRTTPTIKLYSYAGTADRVSTGASGAGDLVYTNLTQWGATTLGFNITTAGTTAVHANWTANAEL